MSISYRHSTAEDFTYIKRLNFLTEVFGDETRTPSSAEFLEGSRFYVDSWDPARGGIVAMDDDFDNPVGAVWLLFGDDDHHGTGYVDADTPEIAIAVEQRYQGRGVSSQLLDRAVALAESWGCPGVSLCVHRDNATARAVYEHKGFSFVRHGEDGYDVMVRRSSEALNDE